MLCFHKLVPLVGILMHTVTVATFADPSNFAIRRHAHWRYHASVNEPEAGWNQRDFDDGNWRVGPAGFGYGDDDDNTVLRDMRGRFRTVYVRGQFQVPNPEDVKVLYLYVNYDDGFIAYLNGTEVAASHASRAGGTLRVGLHEAEGYELFQIVDAKKLLVEKDNVLAIECHNRDLQSSDLSLDPFIVHEKLTGLDALITKADLLADLNQFHQRLEEQSSYLTRRGFDYSTALKRLEDSIDEETSVSEFAHELTKVLTQLGDCHANVHSSWPQPHRGFIPFRLADTDAGVAALSMNRSAPLQEDCPYVESIDDIPLDRWMDTAARLVVQGSPQLIRARSLGRLGQIELLRHELDLPSSPKVTLTLRSADGREHRKQTLRVTNERHGVARVPLGKTRRLADSLGYIRIPLMDNRLIQTIVEQIEKFRDTEGLIIDVRDNGGGRYGVLRAIYGYFVSADAPPYVTNIAAYRLSPRFRYDHINYRPTFRASWNGWSESELAAIKLARQQFQPEWEPPANLFSEWHYMVLSRARGQQEYFHYDRPVAVLCNVGSFSATDGFLSAMADLPQVTLVGEPSGGGSGSTRRFKLSSTGFEIALSSMASFRANGKLFDGNGVEVDIAVKPKIEDYLGDSDTILDHAVKLLTRKTHE